jgi:putative DNA primase/helicase
VPDDSIPFEAGDPWDDYAPASVPDEMPELEMISEGITPLGYDHGTFFYLSRASRQVIPLQAAQHTRNTLMALASSAHYWQRSRFVSDKGAVQWDDAIDWLMGECRAVGVYDADRLRGRGAWIDEGRSVLHVGDRLVVDGRVESLTLPDSRFVYEAAKPLSATIAAPLPTRAAHRLIGICQRLRWERGISGTLLAGFIATAPICGGLAWRPSIWITGGSGSGKSYLTENILAPSLAGIALRVLSKTSEAGIRQALGSDARPVLFDEAEREDAAAATRMQGVLDLVRQSASESGAEIVKGSQSQTGAKRYRIRSSFCFSSINVGIEHQADDSRITVLALRSPSANESQTDAAAFVELNAEVQEIITPEFAAGLVARSVRLLPTIRANAEMFARAVALHLGSRRMGDQLGALLAGAYSLHSEREITTDEAAAYIQRQEWQAVAQDTGAERDEFRLLTALTQARLRVSPGNSTPMEVTIGRLIEAAWGRDERLPADTAETELRANGLRTDGRDAIYVSTNHPALRRILMGTPWATGWGRTLARLPGAVAGEQKNVRFGAMHQSKAVWLSRAVLEGPAT